MIRFFLILAILSSALYYNFVFDERPKEEPKPPVKTAVIEKPFLGYFEGNVKDTLYTDKEVWLELLLDSQITYAHFRDGRIMRVPVSTGNPYISEGVATPSGLYAIQWKAERIKSTQFDSYLIYWMNFVNGIGFHGLEGNGYYAYLGVANVSHGCVRVSREDAKEIYKYADVGTPVLSHYTNPTAVVINFTRPNEEYMKVSNSEMLVLMPQRYDALYNGRYFLDVKGKYIIDNKNVFHTGLPMGDGKKIDKRQKMIEFEPFYYTPKSDILVPSFDDEYFSLLEQNDSTDVIEADTTKTMPVN